jgi:hypothetical protein
MTDQPLKKYRGNCHCGAFVYEVKVPEIKEVYECNCSICYKKGYMLVVVADHASNYEVVKGSEDQLVNYTFGERKFDHKVLSFGFPPLALGNEVSLTRVTVLW